MAIRSGESAVATLSLDRTMTLSLERFHGQTSPPGLADDRTLSSTWTSLKLTRRVAPGTTPAIQEWVGDATATGFSLGHGQMWGRWEADLGLWVTTDMHNMGLDTSYAGFDASLSRSVGHGLRLGAGLDGPQRGCRAEPGWDSGAALMDLTRMSRRWEKGASIVV